MNQQTLIFDLDDTLIRSNKYFKRAENEFVKQLKEWFEQVPIEEIKEKHNEYHLNYLEKYGLHSSKYPETLEATYMHFCKKYKKELRINEIKLIHEMGQSLFKIKVEPLPHMYKVLKKLKADHHQLFLYTGGDIENQCRKITQLDLEPFFEEGIFIFENKNKMALQKVLNKICAEKNSTWMIGNSLRTDIKQAIDLGINAIYIPSTIEWSYNILDTKIKPQGTLAELPSLLELPEFLRDHIYFNETIFI
ncbi:HAD family hydrolase [Neobacillus drentensis]|uniref:HAD family hydrolase n=1 Tax=Neobacillus drentensis TaxID=220684 RepID=UPI001F449B8F|nr:HAD family hydrolase [Neobacillus drentensis]ULT59648.1 HAD family hydrolase [Neobacillus drentensis]